MSIQPFEPGDEPLPPEKLAKTKGVFGTWAKILGWAKRYGVKVAFGTDLVFQPDATDKQNLMLTRFSKIYSNIDTLRIATSGNCELFSLSGDRKRRQSSA